MSESELVNNISMVRKLDLQVPISVDGCIARPNGEMDCLVWNWDNKLTKYVDILRAYMLFSNCVFFVTYPNKICPLY